MPLRAWNKIAMMAQSTISPVLLGLVIARAVNVLRWAAGRSLRQAALPGRARTLSTWRL
jgi:hypothetical protein